MKKNKKHSSNLQIIGIDEFSDRILIFNNAFLIGLVKGEKEVKIEVKKGEVLKCNKFEKVFVASSPFKGQIFNGEFSVFEWFITKPKTRKIEFFDFPTMKK